MSRAGEERTSDQNLRDSVIQFGPTRFNTVKFWYFRPKPSSDAPRPCRLTSGGTRTWKAGYKRDHWRARRWFSKAYSIGKDLPSEELDGSGSLFDPHSVLEEAHRSPGSSTSSRMFALFCCWLNVTFHVGFTLRNSFV